MRAIAGNGVCGLKMQYAGTARSLPAKTDNALWSNPMRPTRLAGIWISPRARNRGYFLGPINVD